MKHAQQPCEPNASDHAQSRTRREGDLVEIIDEIDVEMTGRLTKGQFVAQVENPCSKLRFALEVFGYDISDAELLFARLSNHNNAKEVSIQELAHAIVSLKGGATSLDVCALSDQVTRQHRRHIELFAEIEKR